MSSGRHRVMLFVSNLERAFEFYVDLLGLQPVVRWHDGAHLIAGDTKVCLNLETAFYRRPLSSPKRPIALLVSVEHFAHLCVRLLSSGAMEWQDLQRESDSFRILDPDGHELVVQTTAQDRLEASRHGPPSEVIFYS